MSGGKETKQTNQMIGQDRSAAQGEHNQYLNTVNQGIAGSTSRASDMYGTQYGGFKDFAEGKYDYNPAALGAGGGGGGGGGGVGDPRFGDVEGSYRNFMGGGGVDTGAFNRFQGNLQEIGASGGWSPEQIASMNQNIQGYKDIARTGGVDEQGQARMRGGGVFDEFAKTGGISPEQAAMMRSRSTSTIPAFYQQMQNEQNRMGAIQGGYGPGRAAMGARLARDQATAGATASREAELGISQQQREGRQWGGTNIAQSEAALQSLLSSNKLAGLGGASSTEANMINSIAQNRMGASTSGGGNEIGMQGLIQKGKMFGTQGLEGMAESAASRAAASGAASSADAKWIADFNRDNRLSGLEGMQSLYGMRPGEVDMYLDKNLEGRQLAYNQQGQTYDARMQNNPKRDWASTIGSFAGAAGGAMTGLGAMGFGAQGGGTAMNVGKQFKWSR